MTAVVGLSHCPLNTRRSSNCTMDKCWSTCSLPVNAVLVFLMVFYLSLWMIEVWPTRGVVLSPRPKHEASHCKITTPETWAAIVDSI